ncbi:hypothetical protein MTO96_020196 [Rhipicephalus appendiculatus]
MLAKTRWSPNVTAEKVDSGARGEKVHLLLSTLPHHSVNRLKKEARLRVRREPEESLAPQRKKLNEWVAPYSNPTRQLRLAPAHPDENSGSGAEQLLAEAQSAAPNSPGKVNKQLARGRTVASSSDAEKRKRVLRRDTFGGCYLLPWDMQFPERVGQRRGRRPVWLWQSHCSYQHALTIQDLTDPALEVAVRAAKTTVT